MRSNKDEGGHGTRSVEDEGLYGTRSDEDEGSKYMGRGQMMMRERMCMG